MGLVSRYAGGRPAKLATDQKAALIERLRENDHWTTVEVQQLIQSQFGLTYGPNQVRQIQKSFGMRFGKPYPRITANRGMQKHTSKKLPWMSKHTVLGFLDGCSPQTTVLRDIVQMLLLPPDVVVVELQREHGNWRSTSGASSLPGRQRLLQE